jgi:hypothetical protein
MTRVLALSFIAVVLCGCMSTRYSYTEPTALAAAEAGQRDFSLAQTDDNDALRAYQRCQNGVQSTETVHTAGDVAVAVATLSIYSPQTVRITCNDRPARGFYLDGDDEQVVVSTLAGDVL